MIRERVKLMGDLHDSRGSETKRKPLRRGGDFYEVNRRFDRDRGCRVCVAFP